MNKQSEQQLNNVNDLLTQLTVVKTQLDYTINL